MATLNTPVKIPEVPGKITHMKKGDRIYVRYETGRTCNSARKSTNLQRKVIGLPIRNSPTLMLPNENYEIYFAEGAEKMNAQEQQAAQDYEAVRGEFRMLNSLFDQMYFEFQIQAHRSPHTIVNEFKIRQINRVLEPLRRLMAKESFGAFLETLEAPRKIPGKDGEERLEGLESSDVALVLTQYKGAMTRFSADCL